MSNARLSTALYFVLIGCGRAELTAPEQDAVAVPPQVTGETRRIVDSGTPPRFRFDASLEPMSDDDAGEPTPRGDAGTAGDDDAGSSN